MKRKAADVSDDCKVADFSDRRKSVH